jgi:hypothetical protein
MIPCREITFLIILIEHYILGRENSKEKEDKER